MPPGHAASRAPSIQPFCDARHSGSAQSKLVVCSLGGLVMAGIARNIELYQLAYKLSWPHVSEFQKNADPNIALRLHDSISRRLKQGATEPVLIASEALKDLELNGQADSDKTSPTRIAGPNGRLRRA